MINMKDSMGGGMGGAGMHEPGAAAQSLILIHTHKTERASWEQRGLLKSFTCTHTCISHTHAHRYLYTQEMCLKC